MVEAMHLLDEASSAAVLGASVAQGDGVLYVVGGHDRGPQRPEDSDPWLRVTAIDVKRGDGRYWTPDSENMGLVNRFGHCAFLLRRELYARRRRPVGRETPSFAGDGSRSLPARPP